MKQLAESLIYRQPIDPRGHLIEVIEEMIEARERGAAPRGLLDETNINAIFGLIDVMGKETIALRDALSVSRQRCLTNSYFSLQFQYIPILEEVIITRYYPKLLKPCFRRWTRWA